ncbi:hypothetical protein Tco_1291560, partial [Tanacetum coccineum]
HLVDAKVLSKFDLKSGFWQLGIKPEDRLKTPFCIPDHHYQWKSHAELLSKFYSLVTKYGIMLSEKKMKVDVTHNPSSLAGILTPEIPALTTCGPRITKFPARKMPPLKIPASAEKRILQTDASDECWGVVLLVQDNNNKGTFVDTRVARLKIWQHITPRLKKSLLSNEALRVPVSSG